MHMTSLPSALECFDDIRHAAGDKPRAVFLDYDGTLTPIVSRPEDAQLSESMRLILRQLTAVCPVAIVSGRDLKDVHGLVALDELYYAGSHGFEIAGPQGFYQVYQPAQVFLADLDGAERALRDRLSSIDGAHIERKHFAIAVHVRRVSHTHTATVTAAVDTVQQAYPALRQTGGKKVIELRPDLAWNKGTALPWLLEAMGFQQQTVFSIYIGDDLTDEDAFMALRGAGVGIVVADETPRDTAARYALANIEEVHAFLAMLVARQEG
jgi:trehalose-phosphatase